MLVACAPRRAREVSLIAHLRCPACTGALDTWRCVACGETYPVVDGIPVLVPPGSPLRSRLVSTGTGLGTNADRQREYWEHDAVHRDVQHPVVKAFAEQRWAHVGRHLDLSALDGVLDVGCGNGFSSVHAPFRVEPVGCDGALAMLRRNPLANRICADAATLPFDDDSFDLVMGWELLHHVAEPWRVLAEMRRVSRRWVLVFEPNPLNPAQLAFALADREHRWVLRFTPGYLRRELGRAGLTVRRLERVGLTFPNRTPTWLHPLLRALPFRVPALGISHFALASKAP